MRLTRMQSGEFVGCDKRRAPLRVGSLRVRQTPEQTTDRQLGLRVLQGERILLPAKFQRQINHNNT